MTKKFNLYKISLILILLVVTAFIVPTKTLKAEGGSSTTIPASDVYFKVDGDVLHIAANNLDGNYILLPNSNPLIADSITQSRIKTAIIETQISPTSYENFFSNLYNLTEIQNIDNIDTSNAFDLSFMFRNCHSLTSLDVSHFDTRNAILMSGMFDGCSSITSLDVSNFDTSSVNYMVGMFSNCSKLQELNLSNFITPANFNNYAELLLDSNQELNKVTFSNSLLNNLDKIFFNVNGYWRAEDGLAVNTIDGFKAYLGNGNQTNHTFVKNFKIKWLNEDGTILLEDELAYGTLPSYTGHTPTKAETEEKTYTFKGWSPSIEMVSKDATYRAEFNESPKNITSVPNNSDSNATDTINGTITKGPNTGYSNMKNIYNILLLMSGFAILGTAFHKRSKIAND